MRVNIFSIEKVQIGANYLAKANLLILEYPFLRCSWKYFTVLGAMLLVLCENLGWLLQKYGNNDLSWLFMIVRDFINVTEERGEYSTWNLFRRDPANIYLIKINNRSTTKRCEIYSKLPINTPERLQWRHSNIFIVNFEHISHLFLVFLLLTWNK